MWEGMASSRSLEGARLSQDLLKTITSSKLGRRQPNPLPLASFGEMGEWLVLVRKTGLAIVPVLKDGHEGE